MLKGFRRQSDLEENSYQKAERLKEEIQEKLRMLKGQEKEEKTLEKELFGNGSLNTN